MLSQNPAHSFNFILLHVSLDLFFLHTNELLTPKGLYTCNFFLSRRLAPKYYCILLVIQGSLQRLPLQRSFFNHTFSFPYIFFLLSLFLFNFRFRRHMCRFVTWICCMMLRFALLLNLSLGLTAFIVCLNYC